MRTILVNCYRGHDYKHIENYLRILEKHSEVEVICLGELTNIQNLPNFDAIVFSGSEWMLSEEEADEDKKFKPTCELVGFIRSLKIPTLGICFGHQFLAFCFGAKVKKLGRKVRGKEIVEMRADWALFDGLAPMAEMEESHEEYVTPESVVKAGFEIGAWSKSCPVEAIRHKSLPIYGVQFHPEKSEENGEKLARNFYRNIVEGGDKR